MQGSKKLQIGDSQKRAPVQSGYTAVVPRTTKGSNSKIGANHGHTLSTAKSVKKIFDNNDTFSLDGLALVQHASMADQYSHSSTLKPHTMNQTNDINIQDDSRSRMTQPRPKPYHPYSTLDRCNTTQSQNSNLAAVQKVERFSAQDNQSYNTAQPKV